MFYRYYGFEFDYHNDVISVRVGNLPNKPNNLDNPSKRIITQLFFDVFIALNNRLSIFSWKYSFIYIYIYMYVY